MNNSDQLSKKETHLLALSVAANEKYQPLIDSFSHAAIQEGATDAEIAEVLACTSLLAQTMYSTASGILLAKTTTSRLNRAFE